MIRHWILDADLREVPCPDPLKWARWFESADRKVGLDLVGEYHVSTVFLGLDYSFKRRGKPLIYETMVFYKDGTPQGNFTTRYSTWTEAEAGHQAIIKRINHEYNRDRL